MKRKTNKERARQATDKNHSPDYNYEIVYGKIAGVDKGNPMSFEQANGGAPNPYFENNEGLFGYKTNCQTCVVAFEARQRGYDVRALPNNRNPYIKDLARNTNIAYIDEYGNPPQYMEPFYRENKRQFFERVIQEGKRYTVEWAWNERAGHIISVQRVNGELVFYDPQSSKKYSYDEFKERCISRSMPGTLKVLRIDNCEFNPEYVNYILKGNKND